MRSTIDISESGGEELPQIYRLVWKLRLQTGPAFISLLIGSLLSAAWLYPDLHWVSLIGQSWLVAAALRYEAREAFVIGCVAGTVGLSIAFHWSPASITETTNLAAPWPHVVFLVLVMWESVIFGMFAFLISLIRDRHYCLLLLVPACWVAFEFHWPRVFHWAIAHTHTSVVPMLQLAEFAGTSGVSAVLVLAAVGLGYLTTSQCIEHRARLFVVAFTIVGCTYLWGHLRIKQVTEAIKEQPTIRIAAIQVDPTFVESTERMRELSRAIDSKVDLVLWPESSIGQYHDQLADFRDPIRVSELSESPNPAVDPVEGISATLLAGGKTYDEGGRDVGPYRNTAFLIDPDKSIIGRYVKRTLIPFGEYVPGETFLPRMRYWAALESSLIRGTTDDPLVLRNGTRIGALICYEDMISANARRTVAAGAECLAVIINGSAFHDSDTLVQHLRLAQLRAVENRRSMLRCAATGITCQISATGRIDHQLPAGIEGKLVVALPLSSQLTVFTRQGEWFAWLCTMISMVLGLYLRQARAMDTGHQAP